MSKKDDKSGEKWKNGGKSSKSTYGKVVEKHRHISRSTRSRFSCLISSGWIYGDQTKYLSTGNPWKSAYSDEVIFKALT